MKTSAETRVCNLHMCHSMKNSIKKSGLKIGFRFRAFQNFCNILLVSDLITLTSFEKVYLQCNKVVIESPKLLELLDPLNSNRIAYAPNLLLLPSCLLMHPIKCKGSLSPKRLPEPAVSARRALLRKILDFKMYFSSIRVSLAGMAELGGVEIS